LGVIVCEQSTSFAPVASAFATTDADELTATIFFADEPIASPADIMSDVEEEERKRGVRLTEEEEEGYRSLLIVRQGCG